MTHLRHEDPKATVQYDSVGSRTLPSVHSAYTVFRAFCRNIGAGILVKLNKEEEPKELLSRSRWDAIARCGIHVLPSCVSIVLVALNFCGWFIGPTMQGGENHDYLKLAVLQICAKAQVNSFCPLPQWHELILSQELLVVGSIGAIILHVVRSQIIDDRGLPLGFLTCSFSFTSLR
jgi:hypothetical protein